MTRLTAKALTDLNQVGIPLPSEISTLLLDAIRNKHVEVHDAMTLVAFGMRVMDRYQHLSGEKKGEALRGALEILAKGPDGEAGTTDDILPPIVWKGLDTLLSSGLLSSTLRVLNDARKGKFPDVVKETKAYVPGCLAFGKYVAVFLAKHKKH